MLQKPDVELKDLIFALLGFNLASVLFFLCMPSLGLWGTGLFTCAIALWGYVTISLITQELTAKRLL
jgi:hypothetical protein